MKLGIRPAAPTAKSTERDPSPDSSRPRKAGPLLKGEVREPPLPGVVASERAGHEDAFHSAGFVTPDWELRILARPMDAGQPIPEADPARVVLDDPPVRVSSLHAGDLHRKAMPDLPPRCTCHTPAVRPRPFLMGLLVVAVGACGGPPSTTPIGSPSAAASGLSGEGLQAFKDGLAALEVPTAASTNLLRDQLTAAFDLRGSLGEQADAILALVAEAERAAYSELPDATPPASRVEPAAGVVTAAYVAAGSLLSAQPPTVDLLLTLPGALEAIGRPGAWPLPGPHRGTATAVGDGMTATVELTTITTGTITGSAVKIEITRETHAKVIENASGAIALDASGKHTVVGEMDVCPTGAGASVAGLDQAVTFDARTNPGALGRVGTHSTGRINSSSDFRGQVDDAARLGSVTQDYAHDQQWTRTAAATGGPEARREGAFGAALTGIDVGVPAEHDFSPTLGDFSRVEGTVHLSGDATQQMINSTMIGAAWDFATMDQAYVAAQKLWRNSRCVMVAVPEYGAESEFAVENQGFPFHREEVDKGSTTPFEATLKHRFGQSVTAPIEAELVGEEQLTPTSIAQPPGTLTYTAPDDDAAKATVKMTSTSKQGIGILAIAFDVGQVPGWSGTITLVEETRGEAGWSERHLTVNVRLKAAPGRDDRFDDDGSSYEYEGSSHTDQELSPECHVDYDWTSTGDGPFGEPRSYIFLSADPPSAGASLQIRVAYTTVSTLDAPCLGPPERDTLPDDWWSPSCGTASRLFGTTDADGRLDFSCTAPVPGREFGSGTLTVTGSLIRDDAEQ